MSDDSDVFENVITSSEARRIYGLSESAVRVAIHRGYIKGRKSGMIWLLDRRDANALWGHRLTDSETEQNESSKDN